MPSMLKIVSTITEPPSSAGRMPAETVMSGSRPLRNTWRHSTSCSRTPLARAVRAKSESRFSSIEVRTSFDRKAKPP